MHPNTPTDMPHRTIVLGPLPNHTIINGASADLGRLFNTIRNGSTVCPKVGMNQKSVARIIDIPMISKKLITDSNNVTPICSSSDISFMSFTNNIVISFGELK